MASEAAEDRLRRPPVIEFKLDEYAVGAFSQWGRIVADVENSGILKDIEVPPLSPAFLPSDVPLFDIPSSSGLTGILQRSSHSSFPPGCNLGGNAFSCFLD
ncbi:unnamed protein product [Gongylonema pulchrum]|uniref:Uncharacterized protein n=1 Tax=Gongylonema pulchrum TaxID=637853 RepID=A0A183EXJ0_9BILA|nr:unnamed protein product [Gongylonema pulchrum]